jgi:hypothetical protein
MSTTEAKWQIPSGKIKVKPIAKAVNPLVQDPEHEAYFLFGTSTRDYCLPVDRQNNLINPFSSKEEQEWLEDTLDVDLNIYKTKDNYWRTFKVSLGKSDKRLDLSNPKDYLEYLVLKANKLYVAPDGKSQRKRATYRYALVEENFEVKSTANKANKRVSAYKFLGKLEEDRNDMLNFLKVYGKKVSNVSKTDFLVQELEKLIIEDIDGFLAVAEDKENYEIKLLIANGVEAGAIKKDRRKYFLPGGDPLCAEGDVPTLANAVEYLKAKSNQDVLTTLKARISNAKEK